MSDVVTICPFCMTLFLFTEIPSEECPECHIGILEDINDYYERVSDSDNEQREDSSGIAS